MPQQDYSPGDLAWAKLDGHPWWPGLVCKSPQDGVHRKINKQGVHLHVQFFATPPSRAWIKARNINPYKGKEVSECKSGGIFYSTKKSLWAAVAKAEKAEFMTTKERLKLVVLDVGQDDSTSYDGDDGNSNDSISIDSDNTNKMTTTKTKTSAKTTTKKKTSAKEPQKPNKKRKIASPSLVTQTFIIGKTKIPKHWESAFVLMDTNDVPEDLTPDGVFKIQDPVPKTQIKLELPEELDHEVNDFDSDDELEDSDADPGWSPDLEASDVDMGEQEQPEEPEEDTEDSSVHSDEDPGWMPSKSKKKMPTKFGQKQKPMSTKALLPNFSRMSSDPSAAKKSTSHPPVIKPATDTRQDVPNNAARNLVITDNSPTGPEPEVGDFVLEKSECTNDNIPFLWRYKRGGLIQKYEKLEENGKVFYQNVLSFSDWWACFAHKYQKVNTQVLFKYRNVEKITLVDQPVIEAEQDPETSAKHSDPKTTSSSQSGSQEALPSSSTAERMQEQEISSTTQDAGSDNAEQSFQIGQYVLDKKDKRNVDNFPIWKIESQILLKKYEATIKNGRLLHKPVKTYRGYRDISKHYIPVKVKRVLDIPGEEHIEVTDDTKPQICVDSSMEEEYEKNPLLRHFYVYMQVFLSQALEPGFLDEVRKTKDPTYMFPLGEIDKIIDQKSTNIERKVKWIDKVKDALRKCPYLREVNKPDEKRKCEGLQDSEELVEESVFLFGSDYSNDTLKQSGNSHPCQEFKIGKTAIAHISTYHQLCHFRYNLYDKCLAKIKLIRDSKEGGVEVEKIMDECLGNKSWVLQNFEDFMTLVEIT